MLQIKDLGAQKTSARWNFRSRNAEEGVYTLRRDEKSAQLIDK
jgi:hypothetical protein